MASRRLPLASPEKTRIVRTGEEAIIEYTHKKHWRVHFRMGPELNLLTDQEILDRWNDYVASVELSTAAANPARQEKHRAVSSCSDQGQ